MTRAPKFLLIFAMLASAGPLDLSAWKYRKKIPVVPGDELQIVKLDREVYVGGNGTFTDLRVVRDGEEVPWTIHFPAGEGVIPGISPLLDKGLLEGKGVRFTLKASEPHDRVQLITREENFRNTVVIEASQDGQEWAVLRSDGLIFGFAQDGRKSYSTEVRYPVSTRKFLRITVVGWMDASTMAGGRLELGSGIFEPPMETLSTIEPVIVQDASKKATVLTLDQGVSGLPIQKLLLSSNSPRFYRGVSVEISDDGTKWVDVGSSRFIRRIRDGNFLEENLEISPFGDVLLGVRSRYQRIFVYNGDDKPLQFGQIVSEGRVRLLKFWAPEKGEYWLYYGNPAADTRPKYDILETLTSTEQLLKTSILAGPTEVNPTYRPPPIPPPPKKPWSEQHPAILYTVLGVAVLALGIATLRFMSRLRTPA